MARKKSKGKKPPETMRQRQMRLRKMEKQLKGAKKQLPPGKKGGALVKSGSSKPMSPRLKAALDKKARAAKGTKGTGGGAKGGRGLPKQTPKLPPASSTRAAARSVGNVVGPISPALRGIARVAGPTALFLSGAATAQDLAKSLKRVEGIVRLVKGVKNAPKAKVSQSNRGRRRKPSRKSTNNPKSRATSRKVGPKAAEGGYTISTKAREAAANLRTTKTPKTDTKTTVGTSATAKLKRKTSGVGPVKSGRSYSVGVSGKSVSQQRADELRQMQKRSRERQEAQRKSIADAKKKREERKKQQQKRKKPR